MNRYGLPDVQSNLIDRAVAYFNPVRAAERHRARMVLALSGGYTGARRDRRATQEWRPGGGSADADILPDLPTLRERSRDISRNVPLGGGAICTVVTNVVGTGLNPQSMLDRTVLGISDTDADAWQRSAELEWWLWAGSQECDATRTQDFSGLQDLVFRSTLESGDVFVLKRFIERPGSPYGLKLQVIEGDRVTNPNFKGDLSKLDNGRLIAGGVEVDSDGAPVAYHVQKTHPGDIRLGTSAKQDWQRLEVFGRETGERMIYHLFNRLRPDQKRGVPYLAPVIEVLKQLGRYSDAEIQAAVISAYFTVFIETEMGEGMDLSATQTETGGRATDEDMKLASGAILNLAKGEKVSTANPGRPNTSFDPFVQAILAQIGVALELPFEILNKRFTASYSASRAAMLEAWKFFRARREWLAWYFCQPIYEAVIAEAVARGRLDAPGFFEDALVRKAWLGSQWTGPPQGQIDPEAEINAAEKRVTLGVSTLQEVTSEMTGGDWEAKNSQRGKEERMRTEAGLAVPSLPAPESAPPPPRDTQVRRQRREELKLRLLGS